MQADRGKHGMFAVSETDFFSGRSTTLAAIIKTPSKCQRDTFMRLASMDTLILL
jgi:hypothetical protein